MFGSTPSVIGAAAALLLACLSIMILYGPDIIDNLLLPRPPSPETSSGQPRRWGPHEDMECSVDGKASTTNYTIHVKEDILSDLNDRLVKWRPPGAPMEHSDSWSYGADSNFIETLARGEWRNNYDWRKYEAQLNDMGMSETVVDGLLIRMHHIRRDTGSKAILLLHGWPGSIWEFHRFIKMMQNHPALDEYSILCPSLPGYGFSSAPTSEGYNVVAMAGTMQRLMEKLGYQRYIIQAGDWGSMVAQAAAYLNPSPLIGLHLNFFPVSPSPGHFLMDEFKIRFHDDANSQSRALRSRNIAEVLMYTGYMHQQATKPETLGFALSDSPIGLCAWISEKLQSWSDPSLGIEEKFDIHDIITNCMIYWVTNSITSSMRLYKEHFQSEEDIAVDQLRVNVPVALSLFPHELLPPADASIRRKFQNIILFRKHDKGGHFAALEQPDLLLGDLVEFVERVQR